MSTSGDGSPKSDRQCVDNSTTIPVPKVDLATSQAPTIAGHQDVVNAIWPTLMREVEGLSFY